MQASVVARSVIRPTFTARQAPDIARTLDRCFGERGDCEFIGQTFVWGTNEVEVTLAPSAAGTVLVMEHNLAEIARRRRSRAMKAAGLAGFLFAMFISAAGELEEETFLLGFIFTSLGLMFGHLIPRPGHRRLVQQTRERLDWTAQRLEALLDAETDHEYIAVEAPSA